MIKYFLVHFEPLHRQQIILLYSTTDVAPQFLYSMLTFRLLFSLAAESE